MSESGNVAKKMSKKRYALLDSVRGITLISMILYHGIWDVVYLCGVDLKWYQSTGAYIWQQSICWTFIFLSGYCWLLGRNHLKRGLVVFGAGALVTLVTVAVMPANKVVFGVLTLIGSGMLLMIFLDKWFQKVSPVIGFAASFLLFLLTRNVNRGFLGFEAWNFLKLPEGWYQNPISTYLGFPSAEFFSTDYFSLIPWLFLFISGYFMYLILKKKGLSEKPVFYLNVPALAFLGRHSLLIYLLHQPILYFICMVLF